MDEPRGWTWQDRAEGSIPRGAALDPSVDPIPGIRAYPTAYLPDRMLVSVTPDDDGNALDRDLKTVAEAAASLGWRIEVGREDSGADTAVSARSGATRWAADAGAARRGAPAGGDRRPALG